MALITSECGFCQVKDRAAALSAIRRCLQVIECTACTEWNALCKQNGMHALCAE